MTGDVHSANKALVNPVRQALYDYEEERVKAALLQAFHPDAQVYLAFPFEDVGGASELYGNVFSPLKQAIPDLERRDTIVMAGDTPHGSNWVGCGGYYTGTFVGPWLDIPPTGHQVAMRFHEFFRVKDGRIVEMQALWDIPEVMMQVGAWPMAPSLGREWHVPGPATQDGIVAAPRDDQRSEASVKLVSDMLAALGNFAEGGVEAMRLGDYWHPRFSWYGPSGIGTGRGIAGFRNWHQIPFLNAMPNRVGSLGQGNLFGDGDYVGFTAWPGMHMTINDNGWLGIAPAGQKVTMRQPRLLALRERSDPRKLGAGRHSRCLQPDRG